MKKTRTLTILAVIGAVLLGIGLIISAIGLVTGGFPGWTSFGWDEDGWFWGNNGTRYRDNTQISQSAYWTQTEDSSDTTDEAITSVVLRAEIAEISVVVAEQGGYDIRDYHKGALAITMQNGELRITDRNFLDNDFHLVNWNGSQAPRITIYITQAELDNLHITLGAGTIELNDLQVQSLRIEAGACDSLLRNVTAAACEISQGAGRTDSERCSFNNLKVESGAGEFDFSGTLTGNCTLEGGVGSINLSLTGKPTDYYFQCTQGVGSINIEGHYGSGGIGATFYAGNSTAPTVISIETGVGQIDIDFISE